MSAEEWAVVLFFIYFVGLFIAIMAGLWIKNTWRGMRVAAMKFNPSPAFYGYKLIHQDDHGRVWEILPHQLLRYDQWTPSLRDRERYLRILEVVDTTKGTKHYLRIPKTANTSFGRGAVAWTFGLEPHEYSPVQES